MAIVLFSAALDFSSPPVPEALEGFEEFEEALHSARGSRSLRHVRDVSVPTAARQIRTESVPAMRRAVREPLSRTVPDRRARKVPPALPESASAPEDH